MHDIYTASIQMQRNNVFVFACFFFPMNLKKREITCFHAFKGRVSWQNSGQNENAKKE